MPIEPPKWAQVLVNAANARNRARSRTDEPMGAYSIADLREAWEACRGFCAISGLPFDLRGVGDGQARRPFAPSLDRLDRHKPYRRDNVRLVVSIANFAMNAWGLVPLLRLASAVHDKHGSVPARAGRAPADADLEEIATIDQELVDTNAGIVGFPPRPDLHRPILDLLRGGRRSSREIEDALARQFGITQQQRAALLRSGCPAWRNQVAWALVDLGTGGRGEGKIERIEGVRAPDGGTMGIYGLKSEVGQGDV